MKIKNQFLNFCLDDWVGGHTSGTYAFSKIRWKFQIQIPRELNQKFDIPIISMIHWLASNFLIQNFLYKKHSYKIMPIRYPGIQPSYGKILMVKIEWWEWTWPRKLFSETRNSTVWLLQWHYITESSVNWIIEFRIPSTEKQKIRLHQ